MLGDSELDTQEAQVAALRIASSQQHDVLQNVLQGYMQLLEEHRQLKSDYEEEKVSRERYKKLARSQERNPFVLVLIDGDNHIFQDELLKAGSEGGHRAAHILSNSIKAFFPSRDIDPILHRIVVRIYANLTALSRKLAYEGVSGHEARSIAPFAAGFTYSHGNFDFVDVGTEKGGVAFKIRETCRLLADNNQCKHIFFAGCHDPDYMALLKAHCDRYERFTLVKNAGFHPQYDSLGLRTVELAGLFRATPLLYTSPNKKDFTTRFVASGVKIAPISTTSPQGSSSKMTRKVCAYFPKGTCKYGVKCNNTHILHDGRRHLQQAEYFRSLDSKDNDKGDHTTINGKPSWHPIDTTDFTSSRSFALRPRVDGPEVGPAEITSTTSFHNQDPNKKAPVGIDHGIALLPEYSPDKEGLVPINRYDQRLDTHIPRPTPEAWSEYQTRSREWKLCNRFHLASNCTSLACEFDHTPIGPEMVQVMRYILRQSPCLRKTACRQANCFHGHMCVKPGCKGKGRGCRMTASMHNIDPKVAEWLTQEEKTTSTSNDQDTTPGLEEPLVDYGQGFEAELTEELTEDARDEWQ